MIVYSESCVLKEISYYLYFFSVYDLIELF